MEQKLRQKICKFHQIHVFHKYYFGLKKRNNLCAKQKNCLFCVNLLLTSLGQMMYLHFIVNIFGIQDQVVSFLELFVQLALHRYGSTQKDNGQGMELSLREAVYLDLNLDLWQSFYTQQSDRYIQIFDRLRFRFYAIILKVE